MKNKDYKVLVTTSPFGQMDRRPLDLLEAADIKYILNPFERRITENELFEMINGFDAIIAGTEPITARVIQAADRLKLISRVGIGVDNVDLKAAREREIQVTYTPDAPSPAVAELTIGLMLNLLRNIEDANRNIHLGIWNRMMGRRLSEMTVGIIGVGRIGKRLIQHLRNGFPDVNILGNDLKPDYLFGGQYQVEWVEKEIIYRNANLISLHLPLTLLTRNLIGKNEIELMKKDVLLINTSRGNMIVESDLFEAIKSERISGAAIDVFESEPYHGILIESDRCILTSHMGSMTFDCRAQMELEATQEVIRFVHDEALVSPVPLSEYQIFPSDD